MIIAFLVMCGLGLCAPVASANGLSPKGTTQGLTPAPNLPSPLTPIAGLGAAAGAVALGAWFLRSGTKPGK
jgi:hypothetical protein